MRFLTIPNVFLAILIVISSILLAVAGSYIVRRRVPYSTLKENNEVAGFVYSMVGVVYAVLLAFVVVVVWQQYSDTENIVQQEAGRISNLLRDAQVFPDSRRNRLQERLVAYAKAIVEDEWNTMSNGRPSSIASEAYERLWQAYYEIQPQTEREKVFYHESISRLNELNGNRQFRLLSSQSGIPSALWVLLIGGGIVSIAFTYLFGTKNAWGQALIVASLAGLIGFVLFLILSLDFPFTGDLRIEPEALQGVIQTWGPRMNQ